VECCNFDGESFVLRLSWKGCIFGENKVRATVGNLLDRDDLICFGAQEM